MGLLDGKVAFVTGGSRGIGRAIVELFAQEGAKVAFTYTTPTPQVEGLAAQGKGNILAIQSNVTDAKSCGEAVSKTIDTFSTIDVCVNNAGISKDNLLPRVTEEQFRQVMDVNVLGVYTVTKLVLPVMMRARRGSIVNMSSIVGLRGNAGQSAYAASKAAVIGFTKSVALEYAGRNIRANVIAPGFIQTDMTAYLQEGPQADSYLQRIPLKRYGQANEIAQVALFFASDMSAYVSGQVLSACGGLNV